MMPKKLPKKPPKKKIKNRITEFCKVKGSDLVPCPVNWRTHGARQKAALSEVLSEVGIADVLLAWRTPDGKLQLIDGHMRATEHPDVLWDVAVLDVNKREAAVLLATLDPLSSLAGISAENLDSVLRSVSSSNAEIQSMMADLASQAGLYKDPQPTQPSRRRRGLAAPASPPVEPPLTTEPLAPGNVTIQVGQYRMRLARADFDQWLEELRQAVGFDDTSVTQEIKRRLGLPLEVTDAV
jgi:hypothetical protein